MWSRRAGRRAWPLAIAWLAVTAATSPAQEAPLPEREAFLQAVKQRLQSDEQLLSRYAFTRTDTEFQRDGDGRVTESTVKVFEVSYRGGLRYERLVSVDGEPVPPEELARQDAEHAKRAADRRRERENESPKDRARREKAQAQQRDEDEKELEEIVTGLAFRLERREHLDGRAAIVVAFAPRPGFRFRTDAGKMLRKVEGRAWIDEQTHEIARVDATLRETLSFGWGVLARIHEGSTFRFERQRIADGSWLPRRVRMLAAGRALLLKKIRVDELTEYSNYRRVTVGTPEESGRVREP